MFYNTFINMDYRCRRSASYLTSSKLSVRPARHHIDRAEAAIMITRVIGRNCFHVSLISLSYRIRG